MNVGMATYEGELSTDAGRPRPRPAYAFGLIQWWARLASLARRSNAVGHAPVLSAPGQGSGRYGAGA